MAGMALSSVMILSAFPTISLATHKIEGNCIPMSVANSFETTANVSSTWDKHSMIEFTVKNVGTKPVKNWRLTFTSPYKIENIWCASVLESDGEAYTITNADWNKDIPVGGSVSFGIIFASDSQANLNAIPDWYLLNTKEDGSLGISLESDINYNGRSDYYDYLEYCKWEGTLPEEHAMVFENAMKFEDIIFFDAITQDKTDTFKVDINGTAIDPEFVREINVKDSDGHIVATLNVNGEEGDEIANDGIYSIVLDRLSYGSEPIFYAETTINKFTFKSNVVDINEIAPLPNYSEEEREGFHYALWEITNLDSSLKTSDLSREEKLALFMDLLENLSNGTVIADYAKPTIDMNYTRYDGNGNLYFRFSVGYDAVIHL